MTRLYLLWNHGEHGPEDIAATLDRDKVLELGRSMWGPYASPTGAAEYETALRQHLSRDDTEIAGKAPAQLGRGWGGVNFQIIELDRVTRSG